VELGYDIIKEKDDAIARFKKTVDVPKLLNDVTTLQRQIEAIIRCRVC
jgi:hypothetical protein